jgi:hypothetical protein
MALAGTPPYPPGMTDSLDTKLTREDYEDRFRKFLSGCGNGKDLTSITHDQMDVFFKIAVEFLRDKKRADPKHKRKIQQDLNRCERLMKASEKQLEKMQTAIQKSSEKGGQRTSALANWLTGEIRTWRERLDDTFSYDERAVAAARSCLAKLSRKGLVYEFTLDLELFVNHEFAHLSQKNRDLLIAAAMAALQVFTQDDVTNDVVDRIPMKRYNAGAYYKKFYSEDGRYYPWIPTKKNQ